MSGVHREVFSHCCPGQTPYDCKISLWNLNTKYFTSFTRLSLWQYLLDTLYLHLKVQKNRSKVINEIYNIYCLRSSSSESNLLHQTDPVNKENDLNRGRQNGKKALVGLPVPGVHYSLQLWLSLILLVTFHFLSLSSSRPFSVYTCDFYAKPEQIAYLPTC